MGNASLVLGILSLFTWMLPLIGFPVTVGGIVISIIAIAKKESRNIKSIAGLVMSIIGLVLSLITYILAPFWVPQAL